MSARVVVLRHKVTLEAGVPVTLSLEQIAGSMLPMTDVQLNVLVVDQNVDVSVARVTTPSLPAPFNGAWSSDLLEEVTVGAGQFVSVEAGVLLSEASGIETSVTLSTVAVNAHVLIELIGSVGFGAADRQDDVIVTVAQ